MKLNPCRCGALPIVNQDAVGFFVKCPSCGCVGGMQPTEELAIKAWNEEEQMTPKQKGAIADELRSLNLELVDAKKVEEEIYEEFIQIETELEDQCATIRRIESEIQDLGGD